MSMRERAMSMCERAMSVRERAMSVHGHAMSVRGRAMSVHRHMQFCVETIFISLKWFNYCADVSRISI